MFWWSAAVAAAFGFGGGPAGGWVVGGGPGGAAVCCAKPPVPRASARVTVPTVANPERNAPGADISSSFLFVATPLGGAMPAAMVLQVAWYSSPHTMPEFVIERDVP